MGINHFLQPVSTLMSNRISTLFFSFSTTWYAVKFFYIGKLSFKVWRKLICPCNNLGEKYKSEERGEMKNEPTLLNVYLKKSQIYPYK